MAFDQASMAAPMKPPPVGFKVGANPIQTPTAMKVGPAPQGLPREDISAIVRGLPAQTTPSAPRFLPQEDISNIVRGMPADTLPSTPRLLPGDVIDDIIRPMGGMQNQPVVGVPPAGPQMPSSTGPLSPFWSDPAMDMSMAGKITGGPLPSNEIAKGLASPAGMPRFGGHQPSIPPTPQSQSFPLIEEGVNLPPIRNPVLPQGDWRGNFDPRWFSGEDFTHWPQGAPAPTQATIPTTPNAPALPALPEVLNYNTLPDASRLAEILGLPISKALALLGGAAGGAAGYSMAQGPGFESAPLQEPEPMINIDPATGRPIPNPSIPWHMLPR